MADDLRCHRGHYDVIVMQKAPVIAHWCQWANVKQIPRHESRRVWHLGNTSFVASTTDMKMHSGSTREVNVNWFSSIKRYKTFILYFPRTLCSALSMYKELSLSLNLNHSNIALSIMRKRSICPSYSYFHIIIVQFSVKSFNLKLDLQNC